MHTIPRNTQYPAIHTRSDDMHTIRWEKAHGMCKEHPENTRALSCERVTLIPYGCTILRMTEMPQVPPKE